MTDKEIVDFGRQLVKLKKEIESADAAIPDMESQVVTKFEDDTLNRAAFIESAANINAATLEFRNVFGIQAPCYQLSNCSISIDKNGNDRIDPSEVIPLDDPLLTNKDTKNVFIDYAQAINAAKFDSTTLIDGKLPVASQPFFIDSKKDSAASPLVEPMLPPGYNKWGGSKLYKYICKNFDLTEIAIYNMLTEPKTITASFSLGTFDSKNNIDCVIDVDGNTTKNDYSYTPKDNSSIIDYYNNGNREIPDTCSPNDSKPIKWYNYPVTVQSNKQGGGYKYVYNLGVFSNTPKPIVSYTATDLKNGSVNCTGYAILSRDEYQRLEEFGSSPKFTDNIRFCVHLLDNKASAMRKETVTSNKKFLWWSWTKENTNPYIVTANPINAVTSADIPKEVKKHLVGFTRKMQYESSRYYDIIDQSNGIAAIIPDHAKTASLMRSVIKAADDYLKNDSDGNFNAFLDALKARVKFDFNVENDVDLDKKFAKSTAYEAAVRFETTNQYISRWDSKIIPGWPKWLRRLFKVASTPVYTDRKEFVFDLSATTRNPAFTHEEKMITGKQEYLGPSSGDFTKLLGGSDHGKTFGEIIELINRSHSEFINYLKEKNVYNEINHTIIINGVSYSTNNSTKYDFKLIDYSTTAPSYDYIDRARKIDTFMTNHHELYDTAYNLLSDRINKRTGTLRNLFTVADGVNVAAQVNETKKKNIADLYSKMAAYEIVDGFGTKKVTIKLAKWEPYTTAYANLNRFSTVYFVDNETRTNAKDGTVDPLFGHFTSGIITELIDAIDKNPKDRTDGEFEDDSRGPLFVVTLKDELPVMFKGNQPILVKVF